MEFIMMTGVLFIPMLSSMVHVHVVQVKKSLRHKLRAALINLWLAFLAG